MIEWKVYISGRYVTTVFYTKECDAEYVRNSLIDHDGYPNNIEVRNEI